MDKPAEEHRERAGARFADVDDVPSGGEAGLHPTLTNGTNFTDTEKGSTLYASSTTGDDHRKETAKAERRLLFKLGPSSR